MFIYVYDPKETVFTDQTRKFPQCYGRGNNYQVVYFDIDSNSTWIESVKFQTNGELITSRR